MPYRPTRIENRNMYSYLLILDREKFEELQNFGQELVPLKPENKGLVNSNQKNFIYEDGEVTIVETSAY